MNKRSKLFSVLIYALVFACVLLLCFSLFGGPKVKEVSYFAVSYTHLDVYKRQEPRPAVCA